MHLHRFRNHNESYRLPEPPRQQPAPGSFVLYPLGLLQGMTWAQWLVQQQIYQQAFERAQAVVRPSLPERDLLAVWN